MRDFGSGLGVVGTRKLQDVTHAGLRRDVGVV